MRRETNSSTSTCWLEETLRDMEFGIQNFALMMVTVTALVYSASIAPCDKKVPLQRIKLAANNVTTHLHLMMKLPAKENNPCPPKFFCWAEQSLIQATQGINEQNISTLNKTLHVYNKKIGATNCPLDTKQTYELKDFLTNIKTCVQFALLKLHNCTAAKNHISM